MDLLSNTPKGWLGIIGAIWLLIMAEGYNLEELVAIGAHEAKLLL